MSMTPEAEDFFRSRLDQMIDLRHPLAKLASRMPWQEIEASIAQVFARKARAGKRIDDVDLFGSTSTLVGGGISNAGRPRMPLRLMVSLLYLKHAYNESDEGAVERWGESPVWQYFSGRDYFEHQLPCDSTVLVTFRRALGEEGVEELLSQTINAAVELKLIAPEELSRVIVDTTVQEKAIAHPTDSKLLETARAKRVEAARLHGIQFKQTFASEGKTLGFRAGRYAHARQFRRMRWMIKRQRTIVGRLMREMQSKVVAPSPALEVVFAKAHQLLEQSRSRKAKNGLPKLYSWHAPEVECINKGKSRRPYEFGVKVGIALTRNGNLVVGARSFPGNPYDGHTLNEQMEQAGILMQETGVQPAEAYVDLGYRGVDKENPATGIRHRGKKGSLTTEQIELLARRQAVEPIIGHRKADHRMGRCYLKGEIGDRLNAVLCAAGYNLRRLMRNLARQSAKAFLRLLAALDYSARNAVLALTNVFRPAMKSALGFMAA